MTICQSVFDANGLLLLRRGSKLSDFYIRRLRNVGIKELAVASYQTMTTNFILPKNIISESTRARAILVLAKALDELEEKNTLDMGKLKGCVHSIIKEILKNKHVLLQISDIRVHNGYTLVHSVDTSILSTFIGVLLNLPSKKLEALALGALLHDIGKTKIPNEILNKPGVLNEQEFAIIKKHPIISMRKLRHANCYERDIIDIAMQHHEKINGKGYPYHLTEDLINPLAKIVAVADVYDALTSVRPYKKAYKPHIAYKIMKLTSSNEFDNDILNTFFNHVAIYPIGTVLKTTLGLAIVKGISPLQTLLPTVCLFTDNDYQLLPRPLLFNLAQSEHCQILGICDGYELLNIMRETCFDPSELL